MAWEPTKKKPSKEKLATSFLNLHLEENSSITLQTQADSRNHLQGISLNNSLRDLTTAINMELLIEI
jgi:hypothetical protein